MDIATQNQTLYHIRTTLRLTYGVLPIVAGLDKFTNLLTDWEKYLSPAVAEMLPFTHYTFMLIVGVIEIIAGVLVFLKPRLGAYVVMAWLIGIALNLILSGRLYLDIAVRDLVMAIGAFTLAKVTEATTETNPVKESIQGRTAATPLY